MFSFKNQKSKTEKDKKSKPCHPPPPPHCHCTPWRRPRGSGKLARRCRWNILIWASLFYKMNVFFLFWASFWGFVLQDECFLMWFIFLSCFWTNQRKPWHWPLTNSSLPSEAITLFATVQKQVWTSSPRCSTVQKGQIDLDIFGGMSLLTIPPRQKTWLRGKPL